MAVLRLCSSWFCSLVDIIWIWFWVTQIPVKRECRGWITASCLKWVSIKRIPRFDLIWNFCWHSFQFWPPSQVCKRKPMQFINQSLLCQCQHSSPSWLFSILYFFDLWWLGAWKIGFSALRRVPVSVCGELQGCWGSFSTHIQRLGHCDPLGLCLLPRHGCCWEALDFPSLPTGRKHTRSMREQANSRWEKF